MPMLAVQRKNGAGLKLRRSKTKPRYIWVTQEGKDIPVGKLTDPHLLNAILYLERSLDLANDSYFSVTYSVDYRELLREAARRRLLILLPWEMTRVGWSRRWRDLKQEIKDQEHA